jgi:3'-5' exoribonuclease
MMEGHPTVVPEAAPDQEQVEPVSEETPTRLTAPPRAAGKNPAPRCPQGPLLAALQEGQAFIGYYLARNPRLEAFKNRARGRYLRLQLKDRSAVVEARLWQGAEAAAAGVRDGWPVKVEGVAELYHGRLQVRIRRLRPAGKSEADPERLMAVTQRSVPDMWQRVQAALQGVGDPFVKALLDRFFDDRGFCRKLAQAPAARRVHHACWGGLLAHLVELLELAEPLLRLYPALDRDLLTAGILLHDLGKLEEVACEWDVALTDAGRLLGHTVLSLQAVAAAMATIDGFPESLRLQLLHLLAAHHGQLEWGAPRRPKTLEAVALHHLDNLSAQVDRFDSLLAARRVQGGGWTDYDLLLERALYQAPLEAAETADPLQAAESAEEMVSD